MKVAILYICTGKYSKFFEGFYSSAEQYLLRDAEKTYFVWTDDDSLGTGKDNVRLYHKECAGFPKDSLFRFEMFLQAEQELKQYDYIYFFNSNALIMQPVGDELLPDETGLAMGIWPGKAQARPAMFYPYERNKKSLAYVAPYGGNYIYFMGGLNGGTASAYLEMIRTLRKNIQDDYNRGIIACVHDESHINAYLRKHPCKVLGRDGYVMPEEWIKEDAPKPHIIFRNKVLIDPYYNKGRKFTLSARIKKASQKLCNAARWYLLI